MPNVTAIKQISQTPVGFSAAVNAHYRDGYAGGMGLPVPVEYAVAVDQYLEQAALSSASRRVYRISLAGWAWPLVGKPIPHGTDRRGAVPPVVPLALLDDPGTGDRLAAEFAARTAMADARTANRELSALRGAVGWWQDQDWMRRRSDRGLRHRHPDAPGAPLSGEQVSALFLLPVSLREHALWRLLHDSGASAADVLALDADHLDLSLHRVAPLRASGPASRRRGGHRVARGDEPAAALAARGADVGTGVRHRAAGARRGPPPPTCAG